MELFVEMIFVAAIVVHVILDTNATNLIDAVNIPALPTVLAESVVMTDVEVLVVTALLEGYVLCWSENVSTCLFAIT